MDVWLEESAENASLLVRRGILSEHLMPSPQPLVLHSENGSPMKGSSLLETLYQLDITPSRSRPRVSNDNPYAESIFRTCKYRPNYPAKGFSDLTGARTWVLSFVRWYNQEHRHSGLKFLTLTNDTMDRQIRYSNNELKYMRKQNPYILKDGPEKLETGR
jgi:putative transposase